MVLLTCTSGSAYLAAVDVVSSAKIIQLSQPFGCSVMLSSGGVKGERRAAEVSPSLFVGKCYLILWR
jgi:hypothetical protein